MRVSVCIYFGEVRIMERENRDNNFGKLNVFRVLLPSSPAAALAALHSCGCALLQQQLELIFPAPRFPEIEILCRSLRAQEISQTPGSNG